MRRPAATFATVNRTRVEFTVEPFVDGAPGPHVTAALDAVRGAGFLPDIGPFSTTIEGSTTAVADAAGKLIEAATRAGATRISIQLVTLPPQGADVDG